jgi:hypothetical protein
MVVVAGLMAMETSAGVPTLTFVEVLTEPELT